MSRRNFDNNTRTPREALALADLVRALDVGGRHCWRIWLPYWDFSSDPHPSRDSFHFPSPILSITGSTEPPPEPTVEPKPSSTCRSGVWKPSSICKLPSRRAAASNRDRAT